MDTQPGRAGAFPVRHPEGQAGEPDEGSGGTAGQKLDPHFLSALTKTTSTKEGELALDLQPQPRGGTEVPHNVQLLLEGTERDLHQGPLPLRISNDPHIYHLEQRRIFARNWVFVAHESEIPFPGDYVLRYIGPDRWIVVRDDEGRIQVLFDSCRHRGTQLCRADRGNTSQFRCPYHGWTYKNTGELAGVPNRAAAYEGLNEAEWGLLHAPQVDSYRGLVFACLDEQSPPLNDHLGDFRWYLDIHLALCPQ